jgi:hypothetical protein
MKLKAVSTQKTILQQCTMYNVNNPVKQYRCRIRVLLMSDCPSCTDVLTCFWLIAGLVSMRACMTYAAFLALFLLLSSPSLIRTPGTVGAVVSIFF